VLAQAGIRAGKAEQAGAALALSQLVGPLEAFGGLLELPFIEEPP
jgi:hypothetical protein